MEIEYAILADEAKTFDGKQYIHGAGWDMIVARSLPVQIPRMAVAAKLLVGWLEGNKDYDVQFKMVDEKDNEVLPGVTGKVSMEKKRLGEERSVPICVTFNNASFSKSGGYAITLSIDGSEKARVRFRIVEEKELPVES